MKKRILISAVLGILFLSANIYAAHFQVTDNTTGKVYYTKNVVYKSGGAIRFKDSRTGDKVTLQSSTVMKITKEQFNRDSCGCAAPEEKYKTENNRYEP